MITEDIRHAQALAYVWGRRDEREAAGGNPGTVGHSTDFAEWFCRAQRTGHRTIEDRYAEWVAAGLPTTDGEATP